MFLNRFTRHSRSQAIALIILLGLVGVMPIAHAEENNSKETTAPAAASPVTASVWKLFKSEAGGFSLLMPGEPIETTRDGVVTYSVNREKESVTYTISYIDFPVDPSTEKNGVRDAFTGIKDGIQEEGGKILNEKTVSLKEHTGQELRVSMPDGALTRMRSYIVGKRLYLVMASTKNERSLLKSLEGFLNSFRLITPAAAPPKKPPVKEESPKAEEKAPEKPSEKAPEKPLEKS
jgi:hypothetical protein